LVGLFGNVSCLGISIIGIFPEAGDFLSLFAGVSTDRVLCFLFSLSDNKKDEAKSDATP
jgi:hypothetical protein